MKDLLEPVHISLERRSLGMARTTMFWALAAFACVLTIAGGIGAVWLWEMRCLTRETRTAQQMIAADLHNDMVSITAEISNARAGLNAPAATANRLLLAIEQDAPKIKKAAFDLWKHADRTLGHLDDASEDYGKQQARIADATAQTFDNFNRLITEQADPLFHQYTDLAASLTGLADSTNKTFNDPQGIQRLTIRSADLMDGLEHRLHPVLWPAKRHGIMKILGPVGASLPIIKDLGELGYYGTGIRSNVIQK